MRVVRSGGDSDSAAALFHPCFVRVPSVFRPGRVLTFVRPCDDPVMRDTSCVAWLVLKWTRQGRDAPPGVLVHKLKVTCKLAAEVAMWHVMCPRQQSLLRCHVIFKARQL